MRLLKQLRLGMAFVAAVGLASVSGEGQARAAMVASWDFHEATGNWAAANESEIGNAVFGSFGSGSQPTWVAGASVPGAPDSSALSFVRPSSSNGSGGYAAVATDNVFNFGVESEFSVAVWLKMPNPTGTTGLVTTLDTGAITGWGLVAFAGGNIQFELNPGGGARAINSNAVALMNSGEWFHVAATYEGGNAAGNSTAALTLYINGQQVAGNTVNFGGNYSAARYPDHDLHFGAYANLTRGLQGVLDGVRIYDHVLGVNEVRDLIPSVWNGGAGAWTDADKWSTAWAPGAGGGATIGSGGTPSISETGAVGHVTVENGASLQLQGGITVTGLSLSLMGNGAGNGGALRNLSGVNTWSGLIAMQAGQTGRIGVDSGTLNLSGPITFSGTQTSGFFVVHGAGTLNVTGDISGGTVGGESVATSGGLSGTLILSGNNSYLGYTRINAGTLAVAGGSAIPDASRVWFFGSGRLDLQASETVGSLDSAATGTRVTLNANTLTVGGDNSNRSFAGVISGAGGLTKIGSGMQTLSGNNTYTGATTVNEGTLRVDGNHVGGGLYTVAGGTLSGTGVIGAAVSIGSGGVHAPGASVGEQTVGDAVWGPGGAFQFEINNAVGSPGIAWDRVLVTAGQNQTYGAGVLDISNLTAGSFQIDVMSLAGSSPGSLASFIATEPRTWEFITFDSLAGSFSPDLFVLNTDGFAEHNNLGAGYFEIVQTATGLAIGFVPEPGTLAMAILGLACLLGRRRHK